MHTDANIALRKFVAPEVIFGLNALDHALHYVNGTGARRVLLVTDKGVCQAGWPQKAVADFTAHHIDVVWFDEVSANPRDTEVMKGAALYREQKCDCILAVGGGSPMDCAKGIGIVASNGGHILDFEGVDLIDQPIPPLICVPTTGGTSADVSQFAIIADTSRHTKIAIISKAIVPDVALIDPQTLTTMDAYLTACTGMDALVHAIEAFVSTGNSPLTDIHALEAVRLLKEYLLPSILEPMHIQYRAHIMRASMEAGFAFSNASLGAVHAMAHSLGGFFDLPHGECNSMLLRHVVDFNFEAAPDRFAQIAKLFGVNIGRLSTSQMKKALLAEIDQMRTGVNITATLGQRGVKPGDIGHLSLRALGDACLLTNPRKTNQRDIEVLYEEAL